MDGITEEERIITTAGASLTRAACVDEEDVIRVAQQARVLLVQWAPITRRVIEALPGLELIVRYGVGLDNIDLAAAAEHGVAVSHAPDYCVDEVAEHTVALLLALQRRLPAFDRRVREGNWATATALEPSPMRLAEQTIGIIGFGRIGQRVATLLGGFGPSIRVFDPQADPAGLAATGSAQVATLDGMRGCHALTLHCPLTPETDGLINDQVLGLLARRSVLVNTARGPLVDADALVRALESGHLGGAGLDTFDPEPIPVDHPLLSHPNVILTPHVAWLSNGSLQALQRETAMEAARFLTGKALRSRVRIEV